MTWRFYNDTIVLTLVMSRQEPYLAFYLEIRSYKYFKISVFVILAAQYAVSILSYKCYKGSQRNVVYFK